MKEQKKEIQKLKKVKFSACTVLDFNARYGTAWRGRLNSQMDTPTLLSPIRSELSSRRTNIALALLVLSVFLNYIDRSNLSIALPYLKDELGLSPSRLGILLSAFFWTYSTFQLVSGWLVDRIHVGWVLAAGFLLWSAATGITGLLHSFAGLVVVRAVLGIGESVAYPAYSKILGQLFPEAHRGFANSLVAAGAAAGPGIGLFVAGTFMARFGWRPFFIILGLGSLVWLPLWFKWMPRGPGLSGHGSSTLLQPTPPKQPEMAAIQNARCRTSNRHRMT